MTFKMHRSLQELMVPAEFISPHEMNPNNGDIEAIVESLAANGCYRPIYAMRETGKIVAGHHLYTALVSHGHTEVPVIFLDQIDGQIDLRVLMADNKTAANAKLDEALAVNVLDELESLFGTGFTEEELAEMKAVEAAHWESKKDDFDDLKDVTCPNCGESFKP